MRILALTALAILLPVQAVAIPIAAAYCRNYPAGSLLGEIRAELPQEADFLCQ